MFALFLPLYYACMISLQNDDKTVRYRTMTYSIVFLRTIIDLFLQIKTSVTRGTFTSNKS